MRSDAAPLVEIFASYQGEGPYAGAPQIFVRFDLCNIRCAYCDTPEGLVPQAAYRVETAPFSRAFDDHPNPCPIGDCAEHVARLASDGLRFHSVTFTGGEPLLYADFLAALLPRVRRAVPRTYLDTNGTLPAALEKVIEGIDIVALDIKLPSCPGVRMPKARRSLSASGGASAKESGEGASWEAAEACLWLAARREVFVKVVLTRESTEEEVERAAGLVAAARPGIPMILQPVTRVPGGPEPPDEARMRALLARASGRHADVRVLPQLHPLIGWK